MLVYDKLFYRLEAAGWTAGKVRDSGLIGQATYYGLKKGTRGLDSRTINKLCSVLNCQPGDLMEYIPDEAQKELPLGEAGREAD